MASAKRSVSYLLPPDLIQAVREEAIVEGRGRETGRAFTPSTVVERVLRAYFEGKTKPRRAPSK